MFCLGVVQGWDWGNARKRLQRDTEKLLGDGYVYPLECSNVLWVFMYIKTQQIIYLNICSLVYTNFISMM